MVEPHEKLATALSVAVRIEPELIRAVRLAVFPKFDVSAEADLWFSPLVRSRGPHGIVFDEDAVVGLRAKLASWLRSASASDPVHRLGDVLASVHKRLSPALALEERVTWLAVNGRDDAIDEELLPALKALVQENRSGIADWFTAAWHRLPTNARESLTAWKLAQVVRPDLNGTAPPLPLLRTTKSGPDLSDIVDVLPDARLFLRRNGHMLEVGDFTPDDDTVGIMVPDTDPRLLDVGVNRTVAVRRGASTSVPVPPGAVRVRTARGAVYEVAAGSPVAGQFVAVEVVPDIKLMSILDGFEPLDGILDDDYTLTTVQGRTERDVTQHLELWLRLNQRNSAPLVVYLKQWDVLESADEILDVCANSGSAQILVMVNTPTAGLRLSEHAPNVWMAWISTSVESVPARLARLLTSGPPTAAARQRWSTGGQYITGEDICDEFPSFILKEGDEGPGPMFRNPLHGRPDDTPQWFDTSAEVDAVVRWVRAGEPGVFVITGSAGSGKSSILDEVDRQEPLVRVSTLDELDRMLGTKDPPLVVAIDGLDGEDTEWLSAIRQLSSRGGCAVVTMRHTAPLLQALAPTGANLDLDDMRAHVIRRLTDVHPDLNANSMASFLIETLELPPPLTRRVVHELQRDPVPTRTTGWTDRVRDTLHAAVEEDLRDNRVSRLLLTVLAWSHGSGMPISEWRECATVIGDLTGDFLAGDFATPLVSQLGHYMVSNVRGYRLAHPRLVRYLREQSAPGTPEQIADALATMVLRHGESSPYLRGSLRHHVVDSGGSALARFREVARQDPSWLRELGAAAATLATTTTGDQRVECAETAVQAYTQLVADERRYRRELSSALDQLAASLRAVGELRRADQVWPDAMRRLPENLARWVQDPRNLTPTAVPPPRPMRSYDMVVVVPGVTDNTLRRPNGGPITVASLPHDIGDEHPGDGVVADDLDQVGYAKLLGSLHEHGYTQRKGNLLLLPYDWRLSHRWTGRWIGEQVEIALAKWREKSDPDAKAVFVCVSTGGLPARWYVERCGGAEITAGMITIGTPYRGTMRELEQLVNGAADPFVTHFWRSLPSMYQTLPIYNCVERRGSRVPLSEVTVPVLDQHRVEDGMTFLTDLVRAESSRPHALDNTYSIIGVGHATPVTARIVRRTLRVSDLLGDNQWQGDSYVPTFSASHPDAAAARRFEVYERHDHLHSNDDVLRELTRILPHATPARKR